jgi:hypothetical protein
MPRSSHQSQSRSDQGIQRVATAAQSAGYTYDMLVSLRKLAADHKQTKLVHLIEAAAAEARVNAMAKSDS